MGFTFKENCPDTRNTRVIDIINELKEYGINPVIADPQADSIEAKKLYGIDFIHLEDIKEMDAIILAVAHKEFNDLNKSQIDALFKHDPKVLLDIKGILNRNEYEADGYLYWRL